MELKYLQICKDIEKHVGGRDNIVGVAHCATRLRIVLKNNDLADMKKLEEVDKVKGAFIAGNQLQLIFGAGLVNDVYADFAEYTGIKDMSLGELKEESAKKSNPLQTVIKSLSDVFIGIMPALLAAALLSGITGVLGNFDAVQNNATLYAVNKLVSLASNGIFAILPMAVCYSATKRYGGNEVLGMVVGAIMLDSSLANAYSAAQGTVTPEVISLFGLNIELVGFQGGIIIALMMGFIVAKLDIFFSKKIPDAVKLLVAPLLTVFISTVLLFTIVGPAGRILSNGITDGLLWCTNTLGIFGYAFFAGVQQIIVITGMHHIIGAVEAQLIADTGTNFLNPLMSVALMGQGGAVLGYLASHWKDVKTRELCIPSFCSTLFGISEPAIFGVNLRYRYPLIGGCIGGAFAGAYVYVTKLTALGFGTTALPGIAIANPANNGYVNYIIAHVIALVIGLVTTVVFAGFNRKKENEAVVSTNEEIELSAPAEGEVLSVEKCSDPMFAKKTMGEGIVVKPVNGVVKAPCEGTISFVFPTGHAVGIKLDDGTGVLIHCGINTVEMNGEGFTVNVAEGERVKRGQQLLTFDKALVESKGYSSEIIMVISEIAQGRKVVSNETEDYPVTIA